MSYFCRVSIRGICIGHPAHTDPFSSPRIGWRPWSSWTTPDTSWRGPKKNSYASSFKRFAIPNQLRSRPPLDSLECRIPSGLCRKKRRGRGRGHCRSLVHILWSGQEHFNQQIAAFECWLFYYQIDTTMLLFNPVDRCRASHPGIFLVKTQCAVLDKSHLTIFFFYSSSKLWSLPTASRTCTSSTAWTCPPTQSWPSRPSSCSSAAKAPYKETVTAPEKYVFAQYISCQITICAALQSVV